MSFKNPSPFEIKELLNKSQNIAIVGLSTNQDRTSYSIAKYLQNNGYKIFPVNPEYNEILNEKTYPDLISIPEKIDIVDVFRKPQFAVEIAKQAVEIKAKALWMQTGIVNEQAAFIAQEAGLLVIMDKCIKVEHNLTKLI